MAGRTLRRRWGSAAWSGTQFTWPPGSAQRNRLDLTPDKEEIWQKWIGLYNAQMLSRGEYLGGLYDIGFDRPEAHAIRKSGKMYYAFFAPQWKGRIELRGLGPGSTGSSTTRTTSSWAPCRGPPAPSTCEFEKHLLDSRRSGVGPGGTDLTWSRGELSRQFSWAPFGARPQRRPP